MFQAHNPTLTAITLIWINTPRARPTQPEATCWGLSSPNPRSVHPYQSNLFIIPLYVMISQLIMNQFSFWFFKITSTVSKWYRSHITTMITLTTEVVWLVKNALITKTFFWFIYVCFVYTITTCDLPWTVHIWADKVLLFSWFWSYWHP